MSVKQDLERKHLPQFHLWCPYHGAASASFYVIKILPEFQPSCTYLLLTATLQLNFLNMLGNISRGQRRITQLLPHHPQFCLIAQAWLGHQGITQPWRQHGRDRALGSSQILLLGKQVNGGFSASFVQNKIVISFVKIRLKTCPF